MMSDIRLSIKTPKRSSVAKQERYGGLPAYIRHGTGPQGRLP